MLTKRLWEKVSKEEFLEIMHNIVEKECSWFEETGYKLGFGGHGSAGNMQEHLVCGIMKVIDMPKGLEGYLCKLKLVGMKNNEITESEEFSRRANTELMGSLLCLKGSEKGKLFEEYSINLESSQIQHQMFYEFIGRKTRGTAEEMGRVIAKSLHKRIEACEMKEIFIWGE